MRALASKRGMGVMLTLGRFVCARMCTRHICMRFFANTYLLCQVYVHLKLHLEVVEDVEDRPFLHVGVLGRGGRPLEKRSAHLHLYSRAKGRAARVHVCVRPCMCTGRPAEMYMCVCVLVYVCAGERGCCLLPDLVLCTHPA